MADVKPFRGLRPLSALATEVCSLPYDVMNAEEAKEMAEGNPISFLHVTRAEIDLPVDGNPYAPKVYQAARRNLDRLRQDGVMLQDEKPCFYIYRQQMGDHVQTGLVATVSLDEYAAGRIKKHELTRPDKEQDRVNHIIGTEAQTGPAFLTYRQDPAISRIVEACTTKDAPVTNFTADDGIRHSLWVVDDPTILDQIMMAFSVLPALYIADGHHRCAAAAKVRERAREANPRHTGTEDYNRLLAVIFPDCETKILDYNRVVHDLNGLSVAELLKRLEPAFAVVPSPSPVKPDRRHQFGMYVDGRWYSLLLREDKLAGRDAEAALDVSILQELVLTPILGISDPRTDKRIDFVGGIRGMEELVRRVAAGDGVAFSMYPTGMSEVMAIADAGGTMPPKSTWFEPKLRDAMVVHLITLTK